MHALSDAKFSIERPKYTGKVCDEYHVLDSSATSDSQLIALQEVMLEQLPRPRCVLPKSNKLMLPRGGSITFLPC